ncbi:MAG: ABC transporter substrate-binding protein [Candidatus Borkfalkiaceae bacterium]|nr:ABC transporter substrate-binding protein [Christensenellaceae bacterium]
MKKKTWMRLLSTALVVAMTVSCSSALLSCKKKGGDDSTGESTSESGTSGGKTKDAITLMTEELNGLYNPFYATAGSDMDVIGMTQIGMLSTDSNGQTVAGDDYATVVKDYKIEKSGEDTVYTFVLKNGLKFSDGKPLTINDVMFNMYEYLDPVYSGSSTMYSIKIKGLSQYRTQKNLSSGGDETESNISKQASAYATMRLNELRSLYETAAKVPGSQNSYSLDEEGMRRAIAEHTVSAGYKMAVNKPADDDYNKLLLKDYELALKTFRKELESDFKAAKESYDLETAPYKDWAELLSNDIFKFFLYEGYITPEYKDDMGKKDKTVIVKFSGTEIVDNYATEEAAINRVYGDKVKSELNSVLAYWGTAGTLKTVFSAEAKDVILHSSLSGSKLEFPFIEGIRSLGHVRAGSEDEFVSKVSVNGTTYKVAQNYNDDGTVADPSEYAVLQITVEGTDPKAIYNFSFTVAPAHYYTADAEHPNGRTINISQNQYGVEWGTFEFQNATIQSLSHNEIPVGAGPFKATDRSNSDNPTGSGFIDSNIVYFKANKNFMFPVKCEKIRMQVTSSTNAIDKLQNGELDYIVPQFTKANYSRLQGLSDQGIEIADAWQLGYGYIGVNAGKVPNINVRRAIMSAMQTSLALSFYEAGTCKNIDWPMSMESWAYPRDASGASKPNGHDYAMWTTIDAAKQKIQKYMDLAGVTAGSKELDITFTIAGSSITEHPTYPVFKQAAEILNDLGWDIEVVADTYALTKLATGSLAVWAAAWGSTIDPDMYQVYHKNSSATSVYSWGYREIKESQTTYPEEYAIINDLSDIIDDARSIDDKKQRTALYEEAMSLVLDLAVELPVYQRKNLYAFNSKTVKGFNVNVNPYSSPLEKVWELELVK